MKTAVIILNWNGYRFLENYLPSVVKYSSRPDVRVVVADNGSTDNSSEYVAMNHPDVQWLPFDRNWGFAGGYNKALEAVDAEYVVLLNSDVEVTPGWLEPLEARLDADPKVGAVMPKLKAVTDRDRFEYAGAAGGFIDRLGFVFCRGRLFDAVEKDEGQYDMSSEVFWATGACLMVRRELYLRLGGLDASFFAHMEEIDLCWRMKNAGYTVWYEGGSTVHHLGGGTLPQHNPFKTFLNYRNNLLMLYKNLPAGRVWPVLLMRILLDDCSSLYALVSSGGWKSVKSIFKAHFAFYRLVPKCRKALAGTKRAKSWPSCVSRRSVVAAYFLRGVRRYSDL